MDSGLIQMLVVGLFIVITMMEGATRKKRQQAQALQRPDETEVDFLRSLTGDEQGESEATEGLVPHDIWAEIAELAQGGTRPTPEPMPRMDAALTPFEPDSLVRTDSREEEREEEREAAKTAAFHRAHSSGLADLEKDEHYVTTSERSAMLRLFGERGGREDELRRAVILSEILGPPVSMREPREP